MRKQKLEIIGGLSWGFLIIGGLLTGVATVASIGYGLYLWGALGLAFSVSAWTAFKVWMVFFGTGLVLVGVGFFMGA